MIFPKIQFRAVNGSHTVLRHTLNGITRRYQDYQIQVENQPVGKLVCFRFHSKDGRPKWTLDDKICDYLKIWLNFKEIQDVKEPMYGRLHNPTWPLKILKSFVRHMITNKIRFPSEKNLHIEEIHETIRFLEEKGEFVQ